jgi:signal transduction histidine kinase
LVLRSLEKDRRLDPLLVGRSLRSVTDQADRLNRLIARLLDISRLQAGRLVLECQEIDLKESVDGAAASAQARASQHRITVRSPARLAASVDPVRFEQVIANLLDNAIKYSPDGGPIELELTRPSAASVQLAVRDHGLGIPPERRSQIFDRFYQAHGEGYRSGMGLGLYISRQIVELHGGELWAEFPPDGGSRFVVRLPVRMAGLAATSGQSSDSDGSGPR